MLKSMHNFKNILRIYYPKPISINVQEFSIISTKFGWKPEEVGKRKREPDGPEEEANEKILEEFQSRKGVPADILNILGDKLKYRELLTVEGMKKFYDHYKKLGILSDQRFIDERVDTLGFDLAAAHFVVHRGGKIRFKDHSDWVQMDIEGDYDLPKFYEKSYFVEEIDASGMPLHYEGLPNLENLYFAKSLSVSRGKYIDDFCMDRICDQFCEQLERLDISYCPQVTSAGIEVIAKLEKLRYLNVTGLDGIENLKLVCLLLHDAIPTLEKIEGVDY